MDTSLPLDSLPRAFSQNFILVNDPEGKGEGGVMVSWDGTASIAAASAGKRGQEASKNGASAPVEGSLVINGRFFVQADQLRFVG